MFFLMLGGILPLAMDGFTQYLGLRISNNNLRFSTGLIAGLVLGTVFCWLVI